MENQIPLCPVAGWSISDVKAYEALFIKFDFLTNLMQPMSEANQSPNFLLTAPQAEELAAALLRGVQTLKSAAPQSAPGPRH